MRTISAADGSVDTIGEKGQARAARICQRHPRRGWRRVAGSGRGRDRGSKAAQPLDLVGEVAPAGVHVQPVARLARMPDADEDELQVVLLGIA